MNENEVEWSRQIAWPSSAYYALRHISTGIYVGREVKFVLQGHRFILETSPSEVWKSLWEELESKINDASA